MTLAQFKQLLHASGLITHHTSNFTSPHHPPHVTPHAETLTYLDILSPAWKLFCQQNDAATCKLDIAHLLTVTYSSSPSSSSPSSSSSSSSSSSFSSSSSSSFSFFSSVSFFSGSRAWRS